MFGGYFRALSVQFEDVAGGSIAVKDAVKVAEPCAAVGLDDGADQIWRWDTFANNWVYYCYCRTSAFGTNAWRKYDAGEEQVEEDETEDTIPAGETFFFRRGDNGDDYDSTLTFSGAVKDFKGTKEVNVYGGYFQFAAYPWPVGMPIAGFDKYIDEPQSAVGLDDSADQIWRWDSLANNWVYYCYCRTSAFGTNAWRKYDAGEEQVEADETEDVIPAGEGFFFRRGDNADGVITFTYGD